MGHRYPLNNDDLVVNGMGTCVYHIRIGGMNWGGKKVWVMITYPDGSRHTYPDGSRHEDYIISLKWRTNSTETMDPDILGLVENTNIGESTGYDTGNL